MIQLEPATGREPVNALRDQEVITCACVDRCTPTFRNEAPAVSLPLYVAGLSDW